MPDQQRLLSMAFSTKMDAIRDNMLHEVQVRQQIRQSLIDRQDVYNRLEQEPVTRIEDAADPHNVEFNKFKEQERTEPRSTEPWVDPFTGFIGGAGSV